MSAYLFVEITAIERPDLYALYIEKVAPLIARYGGEYLARGGLATALTGEEVPKRVILIAFESRRRLEACFSSADYRAIAPLREQSTRSRALIVDGYEPTRTE
jgi:uncharacterized protein (DUF1330 family)